MLCYSFRVLRQKNYSDILTEDFLHVQDMLAAILSKGISQQLKQGLYRSYQTYERQQKSLQGKLNPFETRKLMARKMQLVDCTYDELTEDNEMNRILKASCNALIGSPEVTLKQKTEIKKVLFSMRGISDIQLNSGLWNRLQFHRNNQSYEMLMNICWMIWQNLLPSTAEGKTKFTVFEEEGLPNLYEKFILEYYRKHFPELHANDRAVKWDIPEDTDLSAIRMLPGMHSDIMLTNNGKTLIIDAKFYRRSVATFMDKQMIHTANLYQIYAYVKNQDKSRTGNVSGMLLYARTTEHTPPYLSVPIGGNLITVQTLDLNRNFREIAESLDQIAFDHFGDQIKRTA